MRRIRFLLTAVLAGALLATATAGPAAATADHDTPPPAPVDVLLSYQGGTSAQLTWRQPPGERARSFRVYEGDRVVARNTTTSAWVSGPGYASTRTYQVTAVDAQGQESALSSPVSARIGVSGVPPECRPAVARDLRVSAVTASAVTLDWVNAGEPALAAVTGGPQGTLFTDTSGIRIGGLAPNTSYTFGVQRRGCAMAPPSTAVTVVMPPGTTPRPGTPVDARATGQTADTVTLAWSPPVDGAPAVRYAVYDGDRRVLTTGRTSATVRGLYHAARHTFTVLAVDAGGNESAGVPVTAATATCQQRPPHPVKVTADVVSASSVRLRWLQEAAATSYTVYVDGAAVSTSVYPEAMLGGLPSASTSRLRVSATLANGCGATGLSRPVTVTTPDGPAGRPASPQDLRVVAEDPYTGTVHLRWVQPAGETPAVSYRLYRGTEVFAAADTTTLQLRLSVATEHVFTVAAVDAAGSESAHSAPLTVRAPYLPPP